MRFPTHLASLTLAVSCCLAGCMDDAALAQREASKKLNDLVTASQKAMAAVSAIDPAANRAGAESLRKLAASATPVAGALASQKAAMALIAAQLQIQAARLDAAAIEQSESGQRADADNAVMFASLSNQFQLLAKSAVVEVPGEARALLQKDRETSEMTVAALNAQSEKLKGLVDEAAKTIAEHEAQSLELEKKAGELKQRAAAAGPIAGFPLTVESQKTLTDSRKLRSQAANLDLDIQETALGQRMAAQTGDAFQSSLKHNRAEFDALAQIESVRSASAKDLTAFAGKYRDDAIAAAKATREASAKTGPLYDSAIEGLEKAVSLAQQAAGGGGDVAKSAKSSQVSAQLALASMAERRACATSLEISAFTAAAKVDPDGSWSKDAAAAQTARRTAITKATEALDGVLSGLPEGGDDNAGKFRKGIELAKANLAESKAPADAAPNGDANSSKPADAPANDGAKPDAPSTDPTTTPPADPGPTPPTEPPSVPPADPPADPKL